jgi:hypothetical protein
MSSSLLSMAPVALAPLPVLMTGVAGLVATGGERHEELGLVLEVPSRYEPFPTPVTDDLMALRFVADASARQDSGLGAILSVIRIPAGEDPEPLPDPPPIHGVERFVEQRLKVWRIDETRAGAAREGWTGSEHWLLPVEGESFLTTWIYSWKGEEVTWLLMGQCTKEVQDREVAAWRRCAEGLEFFEPVVSRETLKWRKYYERRASITDPESRIRVRRRLVAGWKAEDTDRYVFAYSTRNKRLVNHLLKRIESIRTSFEEHFPPARPIEVVSVVRICADAEEFALYGGARGSLGHWNSRARELVLSEEGDEDRIRQVMFGEGFHQYIDQALDEIVPHPWFLEGCGDYFAGAHFDSHGDLSGVDEDPRQREILQHALSVGEYPSLKALLGMDEKAFYGEGWQVNRAMAGSLVIFLNASDTVRDRPTWSQVLPAYFGSLKAFRGEAERSSADATIAARAEALRASFEEIDRNELESTWRRFAQGPEGR